MERRGNRAMARQSYKAGRVDVIIFMLGEMVLLMKEE